jgi:hypothetical protein
LYARHVCRADGFMPPRVLKETLSPNQPSTQGECWAAALLYSIVNTRNEVPGLSDREAGNLVVLLFRYGLRV